jgi:cytochrome P450
MTGFIQTMANNMLAMDEPDQAMLRGIVDEAFRRRAVLEMEPRILEMCWFGPPSQASRAPPATVLLVEFASAVDAMRCAVRPIARAACDALPKA